MVFSKQTSGLLSRNKYASLNSMSKELNALFSLKGKTALVTGASGGLGRALAAALAKAGATVGLHGLTEEKLEEVSSFIRDDLGGNVITLKADLGCVDHCRQLISDAHRAMGRLDVLVNCAGINRRKLLEHVTPEDFDTITAVNLRSVFFLCQAAHGIMREQRGGKIINIGSMSSMLGFANLSVYGVTKSAVAQLTKTMAVEWARDNIQVNCLAPGYLRTALTEAYFWSDPQRSKWLLDRIPAKRAGMPDDLIGVTLLLASSASSYITGQTIAVDGGFTAGGSWE